jgi:hypothetical protein
VTISAEPRFQLRGNGRNTSSDNFFRSYSRSKTTGILHIYFCQYRSVSWTTNTIISIFEYSWISPGHRGRPETPVDQHFVSGQPYGYGFRTSTQSVDTAQYDEQRMGHSAKAEARP